jgi:hypothetical protein
VAGSLWGRGSGSRVIRPEPRGDRGRRAAGRRGARRLRGSLLDPSPLAGSLDRWIDWGQLAANVVGGSVDSVCVVATSLATGEPVAFVAGGPETLRRHPDGTIRYVRAELRGEHVRASAAIPMLFPTVEIHSPRSARGHYADGGTRLNSDFMLVAAALGSRTRARGELLSFLLFDEEFLAALLRLGARDARRWLRRHRRFWCRDAAHDLSFVRYDPKAVHEQEAIAEFRARRMR